jgi:hypothetical protein
MHSALFSMAGHLVFLRQASAELRDMAAHKPEIAKELRHIASQIDIQADDLEEARRTGSIGLA